MKNYQTRTEDPTGFKSLLCIALISFTINRQTELFIARCLTCYLSAQPVFNFYLKMFEKKRKERKKERRRKREEKVNGTNSSIGVSMG